MMIQTTTTQSQVVIISLTPPLVDQTTPNTSSGVPPQSVGEFARDFAARYREALDRLA
jgi:hypothetical protein